MHVNIVNKVKSPISPLFFLKNPKLSEHKKETINIYIKQCYAPRQNDVSSDRSDDGTHIQLKHLTTVSKQLIHHFIHNLFILHIYRDRYIHTYIHQINQVLEAEVLWLELDDGYPMPCLVFGNTTNTVPATAPITVGKTIITTLSVDSNDG